MFVQCTLVYAVVAPTLVNCSIDYTPVYAGTPINFTLFILEGDNPLGDFTIFWNGSGTDGDTAINGTNLFTIPWVAWEGRNFGQYNISSNVKDFPEVSQSDMIYCGDIVLADSTTTTTSTSTTTTSTSTTSTTGSTTSTLTTTSTIISHMFTGGTRDPTDLFGAVIDIIALNMKEVGHWGVSIGIVFVISLSLIVLFVVVIAAIFLIHKIFGG
jgi:hypothetical protein